MRGVVEESERTVGWRKGAEEEVKRAEVEGDKEKKKKKKQTRRGKRVRWTKWTAHVHVYEQGGIIVPDADALMDTTEGLENEETCIFNEVVKAGNQEEVVD